MSDLSAVLDDMEEDVKRLNKTGNVPQSLYVAGVLARILDVAEDFTTWMSEPEAMLRSGLSERTLRSRFRWLRSCNLARYGVKGRREYLACGVPQRSSVLDSYHEGLGERKAG